jgi:squalene synthase HpnC
MTAALRVDAAAPEALFADLERIAARSVAQMGAENFPVALRLLPRHAREQLVLVYAFARFVDDVGDEARGDRQALLAAVDADIAALTEGAARVRPVRELAPLVARGAVPVQPLHDLVEANRRDQTTSSYETFDDLLEYCRFSAAPVGRLVLSIAEVEDPTVLERSDRVCAALQVLEHCQDVGEDAAAGRVYLPAVDLRAAGVSAAELQAGSTSDGVRRVVADQVSRAESMLDAGAPLVRQLHGWPRVAVAGYVAGGRATAAALRGARFDVLSRTVRPSKVLTAAYALRLLTGPPGRPR